MARRTALDMSFAEVYPALLGKAVRKGRTQFEVDACITWLLNYPPSEIARMLEDGTSFRAFLEEGVLCPGADKVTGSVCGVKIDDIEDPTTKTMRRLDKLIDELAKGKLLGKELRIGPVRLLALVGRGLHHLGDRADRAVDAEGGKLALQVVPGDAGLVYGLGPVEAEHPFGDGGRVVLEGLSPNLIGVGVEGASLDASGMDVKADGCRLIRH